MNLRCLAVDSDLSIAASYTLEWERLGIIMDRVDNMVEAIKKLQDNTYFFIGIKADAVDYMPLLCTMRSMTHTPILIVTGNFTTDNEVAALKAGADLYARWHGSVEDNVTSVLAHVENAAKKVHRARTLQKVLIYKNLLISPEQFIAFKNNSQIELSRLEFDLLHYLILNKGVVLTYETIYRNIWKGEYDDESASDIIKHAIKRLRRKIEDRDGEGRYIENIRGVGYRMAPFE